MSVERRLSGLEARAALGGVSRDETPAEAEKRRKTLREQAEHANRCQDIDKEPLFEIDEHGDVFCTHDGKPVTDTRQTLAEKFYWMEVGWGCPTPGLVHDEEAQTFYMQSGKFALSRDRVDLRNLMGPGRLEA